MVLEPSRGERIPTAAETLSWPTTQLAELEAPPADLLSLSSDRERAERLLETACELELEPGMAIQWYAVRLEPPAR